MATTAKFGTKKAKEDFKRNSGPVGGIAIAKGRAAATISKLSRKAEVKDIVNSIIKRGQKDIEAFNRMIDAKQLLGPGLRKIGPKDIKAFKGK